MFSAWSLPYEILALFFQVCVTQDKGQPNQFFHDTSKAPWKLTHICARWRAVAIRTPSLWTTIRVSVDALETPERSEEDVTSLLVSYLQRSQPLPLSLVLMSEDSLPEHILQPILDTVQRWHDVFIFTHPDDLRRFNGIRGRLPELQALQIIPTRLGEPFDAPPAMFEIAPKLDTLSLGGHALDLHFALPWAQVRSFEANYIDPADVLHLLPSMPDLAVLKLGRELPEQPPEDVEGVMVTLSHVHTFTLNVVEGQHASGHPDDLLSHLIFPALSDLEVECDVEESIENVRSFIERSECRIEALTLVITFRCRDGLQELFKVIPHVQRLTVFDGLSMTEMSLLEALVVRPEDPAGVLVPKVEHITLLASKPLPEEHVQKWLDVFESRVEPAQPQDSDRESDGTPPVCALRSILMGCTSGENIVDNEACLERFHRIMDAGVSVDLWYGPDIF